MTGGTIPTRALRRAALLLGLALAASAQGAMAGVPPAPLTVRTVPVGVTGTLTDLSAKGGIVVVAWGERAGAPFSAQYGGSVNGGDSVLPNTFWNGFTRPRAEACSGPLFQTGVIHYKSLAGRAAIQLLTGSTQRPIENATTDYLRADATCVGSARIAVVVLARKGSATRLYLWPFKTDLTDGGTGFDLGPANPRISPVVVASGGWIHVAWMSGKSLRYQRFRMGTAPGYALTATPRQVIETTSGQSGPELAVSGKRVVLAWTRKGSAVVRASTDRGAHFGPRKTFLQGSPATGKVAFATSADVQGSMLMVAGTLVSEGISASGRVLISTNGGSTWTRKVGLTGMLGFTYATLDANGPSTRIHVATDQRLDDPDAGPHTILLFHRDLP